MRTFFSVNSAAGIAFAYYYHKLYICYTLWYPYINRFNERHYIIYYLKLRFGKLKLKPRTSKLHCTLFDK